MAHEPGAIARCLDANAILEFEWWVRQDSNLEPDGYEPSALTIELRTRPRQCLVPLRRPVTMFRASRQAATLKRIGVRKNMIRLGRRDREGALENIWFVSASVPQQVA